MNSKWQNVSTLYFKDVQISKLYHLSPENRKNILKIQFRIFFLTFVENTFCFWGKFDNSLTLGSFSTQIWSQKSFGKSILLKNFNFYKRKIVLIKVIL